MGGTCGSHEVGIDLGLKTITTMSNSDKYDGLRTYRAIKPKLAKAHRPLKNRRVQRLHAKAKNRGLDGLHKLFAQLMTENKLVAIGNVIIKFLAKTKMAKSVYDPGWGLWRGMLRYKTLARGATYLEDDEHLPSRLCASCGTLPSSRPRGIAQLGIREWVCTNCRQGPDRYINAALNILVLGNQRPEEKIPVF